MEEKSSRGQEESKVSTREHSKNYMRNKGSDYQIAPAPKLPPGTGGQRSLGSYEPGEYDKYGSVGIGVGVGTRVSSEMKTSSPNKNEHATVEAPESATTKFLGQDSPMACSPGQRTAVISIIRP